MARPPRRPGEVVADIAIFGPLIASAILAACGLETTSTCTRTTWRRYVLAFLAWHTWRDWGRWDPLGHLDRAVRSTPWSVSAAILHDMHRPTASSTPGRSGAGAVPLAPPQPGRTPVKSGVAERRTTP